MGKGTYGSKRGRPAKKGKKMMKKTMRRKMAPMGKGTYGSKRGRPAKKGKMMKKKMMKRKKK